MDGPRPRGRHIYAQQPYCMPGSVACLFWLIHCLPCSPFTVNLQAKRAVCCVDFVVPGGRSSCLCWREFWILPATTVGRLGRCAHSSRHGVRFPTNRVSALFPSLPQRYPAVVLRGKTPLPATSPVITFATSVGSFFPHITTPVSSRAVGVDSRTVYCHCCGCSFWLRCYYY